MFGTKLVMDIAVKKLVNKARPKTYALLKTRRFYYTADLVTQFKTHVWSILEGCISAIYHAADTTLAPLDRVQTMFVHSLNLSEADAFLNYNMAPLRLRRDIGMLGLLHKCNLGTAHNRLLNLFPPLTTESMPLHSTRWSNKRHNRQLLERCTGNFLQITRRSIFGLVRVYNFLHADVVWAKTVTELQEALTEQARTACMEGKHNWATMFCPRQVQQG